VVTGGAGMRYHERKCGPVAQRQSRGLIIPWLLVRIQPGPLDVNSLPSVGNASRFVSKRCGLRESKPGSLPGCRCSEDALSCRILVAFEHHRFAGISRTTRLVRTGGIGINHYADNCGVLSSCRCHLSPVAHRGSSPARVTRCMTRRNPW
jgi:hypothetical protein